MVTHLVHGHLYRRDLFLGLLDVELGDFADGFFSQFQHIFARNLAFEALLVGAEGLVHLVHLLVPRPAVALLHHFIDTLLEEYLLQTHPVPAVLQLGELYLELLLQQSARTHRTVAQYLARCHEHRLVVHNHAGLRREADLARCERVQRVYRLVRAHAGGQIDHNLDLGGGVVVHLLYLDFAFLVCLDDAVDQHIRRHGVGQLGDHDGLALLVVVHARTDAQPAALSAVVVAADVDQPARREVGIYLELLLAQHFHARFQQFAEVIRQDHRRQRHRNAARALCQQQGELDGQRHGLFLASVVRRLPLRGLRVEDHLLGELRQAGLDVAAGGGIVAGEYVAPVTLAVDEEVFLSEVDQCVLDAGVAVRMVLHRVAHDVGHLGEPSVVGLLHGMQYSALHGLQPVVDIRHRTVQNHIARIVNPIVLEHPFKRERRPLFLGEWHIPVLFHILFYQFLLRFSRCLVGVW